MKKILGFLLVFYMLLTVVEIPVSAADKSRNYEMDLAVNGEHEVYAKPGDVLTVVMTLRRTDRNDAAVMYAMQDEIRYDPKFFEIIEDGVFTINGIEITDIGLIDDYRAFYVNFLSMGGGEEWEAETIVGSFQVRVLGEKGSSSLKNENFQVSVQDGTDGFVAEVQDLLVIVSSECTVQFDSMGGSEVESQTVPFGEKLQCPEDPVREGYILTGWYKDIHLTEEWNFEEDTVTENMTLFAGWQTGSAEDSSEDSAEFPWWILIVLLYLAVFLFLFWLFGKRKKKQRHEDVNGGEN